MSGLARVLETLNAHYTFDARGRVVASRADGLPPRFVLGRAAEGCVWRCRADLDGRTIIGLARLAGREPGARFDGELPAPPERLASLAGILRSPGGGDASDSDPQRWRRLPVTRDGVVVGELWSID